MYIAANNRIVSSADQKGKQVFARVDCAVGSQQSNLPADTNKPLQPVSPSLCQPAGQSPHVIPPTVLTHLRLMSQPPFLSLHSSASENGGVCMWMTMHTKMWSNPAQNNHRFTPTQGAPTKQSIGRHKPVQSASPVLINPDGQSPHVLPPAVFLHSRLAWQPPLSFAHSSTSDQTSACLCLETNGGI